MSMLRRLWRDRRGASLIELALMSPILMVTVAGTVDGARLLGTKVRLQQAAERTAELASAGGASGSSFSTLQSEAATAANVPASNVTVSSWLECDGTQQSSFDGSCSSGQQVARYASIRIVGSFTPSFSIFFSGGIAVSGSASVRVQ